MQDLTPRQAWWPLRASVLQPEMGTGTAPGSQRGSGNKDREAPRQQLYQKSQQQL